MVNGFNIPVFFAANKAVGGIGRGAGQVSAVGQKDYHRRAYDQNHRNDGEGFNKVFKEKVHSGSGFFG